MSPSRNERIAVSGSTQLTDERLRSWLDADQLKRERLCQAILSLDPRFSQVRPRQPRGGPNGGRDLEALHASGGESVWGAIGFKNTANDSDKHRRWAMGKFQKDLKRALDENKTLEGFVFLTNVNLTVGEKADLEEEARKLGVSLCDVMDRERLRILLDSPKGLGIRYQYLSISLSDAEQASFFAEWGDGLENLVTKSFSEVENRLARLEFLHERHQPLRDLSFSLKLSREVPASELPHFRALLFVEAQSPRPAYSQLHLGVCNDDGKWEPESSATGSTLVSAFWTDDVTSVLSRTQSLRPDPLTVIGAFGGYSEFGQFDTVATLHDLDENLFGFFVSEPVADLVTKARIVANEYLLWEADRKDLRFDSYDDPIPWPFELTAEELDVPWIRIMLSRGVGHFSFSDVTPRRLLKAHPR